jgi:hypothetical protein
MTLPPHCHLVSLLCVILCGRPVAPPRVWRHRVSYSEKWREHHAPVGCRITRPARPPQLRSSALQPAPCRPPAGPPPGAIEEGDLAIARGNDELGADRRRRSGRPALYPRHRSARIAATAPVSGNPARGRSFWRWSMHHSRSHLLWIASFMMAGAPISPAVRRGSLTKRTAGRAPSVWSLLSASKASRTATPPSSPSRSAGW